MADYYCIVTDIGAGKLTQALALGQPVILTHMAVGDGGGSVYNPSGTQTALAGEVYRAPINTLRQDPANPNWLLVECVLPASVGGWSIREAGVYDEEGILIAIAKMPESYKATLQSGAGQDLYLRLVMQHTNVSVVQLKIDPSVVLATRSYVDDAMRAHLAAVSPHDQYASAQDIEAAIHAHEESRRHPVATTDLKGFVELATVEEAVLGADDKLAVTPIGLKASITAYHDHGTWIPTLAGDATPGAYTYGYRLGYWTRLGPIVTSWCSFSILGGSGASGYLTIGGLPYSSIPGGPNYAAAVGPTGLVALSGGATTLVAVFVPGTARIDLYQAGTGYGGSRLPASAVGAGAQISVSAVYPILWEG